MASVPLSNPIFLTCASDNAYAMPLAVMLRSVLENMSSEQPVVIFVIDGGISNSNKSRILGSLSKENCSVRWLSASDFLPEDLPILKDVLPHASQAVYYRLLLASILPSDCRKVIYLDSDLIVLRDLNDLYKLDLEDNYVLAVQDPYIPLVSSPYGLKKYERLGIASDSKYFNSGVLLINLELWRRDNIETQLIQYINDNKQYIQHHDQDVLNAVMANQWGELEPKWNQTPKLFTFSSWEHSPFSEEDFSNAIHSPCIVHFASSSKPWNSNESHPARYLFFYYLDMTSWKGWRFTVWSRLWRKLLKFFGDPKFSLT